MSIKNDYIVWGLDAGTRSLKTFGQSLGAELVANQSHWLNVSWATDLAIAGGASLLSILSNLGSLPFFRLDAKGNIEVEADPTAPVVK